MATNISNCKGGTVSVTATPQQILLVPAVGEAGGHLTANYCKVKNAGASTIYVVDNANATDQSDDYPFYVESTAVPIEPGDSFPIISFGKPIRSIVLACATGDTSTAVYGAN